MSDREKYVSREPRATVTRATCELRDASRPPPMRRVKGVHTAVVCDGDDTFGAGRGVIDNENARVKTNDSQM